MSPSPAPTHSPLWKRLRAGVAASVVSNAISYGGNFLLVSLYLQAWGATDYGRWLTVMALISYISLADLGGQLFVQNRLALHHASGNRVEFASTLSQATALYLWIGLGCSLVWLTAIGALWRDLLPWVDFKLDTTSAVALVLIGLAQFLLAVPFGIFATCYRATGNFARGAMLGNVGKLVLFGSSAVALWCGGGIKTLAAVNLASTVFAAVLMVVDSRRFYPFDLAAALSFSSARAGAPLLLGSFFNWLVSMCGMVTQQAGILILAAFAAPKIVSEYSTHKIVANLAGYIGVLVAAPILPEFAILFGKQDRSGAWRLFHRAATLVALASGLAAAALVLGAGWFFPHWTHGAVGYRLDLTAAMAVQAVVAAAISTNTWILLAHSEHKHYAAVSIFTAVAYVALCYVLTPIYGSLGLVWGGLAVDLCSMLLLFPLLTARVLGLPFGQVWFANLRIVLLGVAMVALALLPHVPGTIPRAGLAVVALVGAGMAITAYYKRTRHPPPSCS